MPRPGEKPALLVAEFPQEFFCPLIVAEPVSGWCQATAERVGPRFSGPGGEGRAGKAPPPKRPHELYEWAEGRREPRKDCPDRRWTPPGSGWHLLDRPGEFGPTHAEATLPSAFRNDQGIFPWPGFAAFPRLLGRPEIRTLPGAKPFVSRPMNAAHREIPGSHVFPADGIPF